MKLRYYISLLFVLTVPAFGVGYDFDGNYFVNFSDYAVAAENWSEDFFTDANGNSCGDANYIHADGDFNRDCQVDFNDLVLFANKWLGYVWENDDELSWLNWVVVNAQPTGIYKDKWTDTKILDFLAEFDPDICDWWSGLPMNREDIIRSRGIAGGMGMEYEYESTLHGVTYLEDEIYVGNGIAIKENGNIAWSESPLYKQMSQLAPKWHETTKSGNLRYAKYGDAVAQDNLIHGVHWPYGQYDDQSNRLFIDYMENKFSSAELAAMGFNPATFHIRTYLANKRSSMANEQLIEEPVIHEYIRFNYIGHIEAVNDISQQVKIAAMKEGKPEPAFYGNLASLHTYRTLGIPLCEQTDVSWIEHSGWINDVTCYSNDIDDCTSTMYKVGRAAGHFQKPVWSLPHVLDTDVRYIQALAIAEAQANNGAMILVFQDGETETEMLDTHRHHAQFVSQNRVLFTDRHDISDVAVGYSLPSLFWRWFSQLEITRPHLSHFMAAARLMEDRHIPYEAIILGHPDIYDDSDHLARLSKYRTLILPYVDCLSDQQVSDISDWVQSGGRLVLWAEDNVGTRDEELAARSTAAFDSLKASPSSGEVIDITTSLADNYISKVAGADDSIATLIDEESRLIDTNAPEDVWFSLWRHGAGPMMSVHMVNYNIDPASAPASITPAQNFFVKVRVPQGVTYTKAQYYTADYVTKPNAPIPDVQDLTLSQTNGFVEVTIPEVQIFGVLSLTVDDEIEARTAAANTRKVFERFKIANRCQGQSLDNHTDLLAQSNFLLDQIQGSADVNDFNSLIIPLQDANNSLQSALNAVTTEVSNSIQQNRNDLLTGISEAVYKFDVGQSGTYSGYNAVTMFTNYPGASGYGWTSLPQAVAGNTGYPDTLHRDYIREKDPIDYLTGGNNWFPVVLPPQNDGHFKVDLPNGEYIVTVVVGNHYDYYNQGRVGITYVDAEGLSVLYGDRIYSGYYDHRAFKVSVNDGSLDLRFWGRNVGPLYFNNCGWLVNALIIQTPEQALTNSAQVYLDKAELASESLIRDWQVLGPFDDDNCEGLELVYGPETDANTSLTYQGKNGTIAWQPLSSLVGTAAYIDFADELSDVDEVVGFAVTFVYCLNPMQAVLEASATQMSEAYVNNIKVFRDEVIAGLLPNEESVTIDLNQGWNSIVLKSTCHWGDVWAMWAGLKNTEGTPLKDVLGVIISDSVP